MLLAFTVSAQYSETTPRIDVVDDGPVTIDVSLPSYVRAADSATVRVISQGDYGGFGNPAPGDEFILVTGEDGDTIGLTEETGADCTPIDTVFFKVRDSLISAWVRDGEIVFTMDITNDVQAFCADNWFSVQLEYDILYSDDDASVLSIDSVDNFCAGAQDVYVTIGNLGSTIIDSVEVAWTLNGVAQPTYTFRGRIDSIPGTGSFDTTVNIGSGTFIAGVNTIEAYTFNPNGVVDTVNFNDTLRIDVTSSNAPENITITNILTSSVDVSAENFPGDLDYEYDVAGFSIGNGNTGTTSTVPFAITGLTAGTTYHLYVRNNCGGSPNDTSLWVGPISFTTSFEVPFSQDFENFGDADRVLIEGWTGVSSNDIFVTPAWEGERANGFDQAIGGVAGPLYDHTNFGTGGGTHMIMNSWAAQATEDATMISPPVFISNAQEKVRLRYWYFMFGQNTQPVHVILDTNGVEDTIVTYTGEQQAQTEDWLLGEHYLTGYAGKSVIVKFKSSGFFNLHRPAIDDVTIDTLVDVSASVDEILEPVGALCVGSRNPLVVIRNTGKNDITSFQVVSDVNGALDTTSVARTISTGDTIQVTLPSVSFASGVLYDLRFYTINPNGTTDELNDDDTLGLETLTTGLVGNVTIDANSPASATNFLSFRTLASRLNSVGVCGNVNVYVAPGVYAADFLQLDNIDGLSALSTLTIDGDSATNGRDSVTLRNTGSTYRAAISFNRTSYVTIKNMTVEGRYSGGGVEYGIHFSNISNHNTIENIFLDMDALTFNCTGIGASSDITNQFSSNVRSNANHNTIIDTDIEGSDISVNFRGPNQPTNGFNTNNQFVNMKVWNFDSQAFVFTNSDSTVIDKDSIDGGRNNFFQSVINMQNAMNFRISNNYIISIDECIRITGANSVVDPELNAEIFNNMISVTEDNHFANAVYLRDPLRIDFWYNSIRSVDENRPAVHFDGFALADSLDIRNNIFASINMPAFQFNGNIDTIALLRFDNNVFYRGTTGALMVMEGVNYTTLAAYQAFRPRYNVNSIEDDPQFDSDVNLHIIGIVPSDRADNSVAIFEDIDGEVRPSVNALFADIGADEYDPPSCPPPNGTRVTIIDADTVILEWNSSAVGTPVQYEYGLTGYTRGTGTSGTSTNDTALVGSLTENTTYDVWIRQICGRGDTSRHASVFTFTTPCFAKQPGYFTGFEGSTTNEVEPCWTEFYTTDNQTFARVQNNPGPLHAGTRQLVIAAWYTFSAIDTSMAISPVLDSMTNGDMRIRFFSRTENTANALIIGTTSAPQGISVFNPIDTVIYPNNVDFDQYYVDLTAANGYNLTDQHVAFFHTGNSTGFREDILIDDFLYEEIPSCLEPRNVAIEFLGSDSLIIGWTDFAGASEWEVEYAAGNLIAGSGTKRITTSNPDTITGLTENTDYELIVRAICTPGDSSFHTPEFAFKTECTAQTADVFEDFDILPTFETPDCWMEYTTGTQNGQWSYVEVRGGGAFSGNNTMQISTWFGAAGDTVAAISPRYEDMTDGDKRLRFQANSDDFQFLQDLTVYTLDKRGAGATWTEMETIDFDDVNTYAGEYIIDLTNVNGYNGTDNYVAFSASIQGGDFVRIDDYNYENIPSCPRPRDLLAFPGTDSAIVEWTNTSPSDTIMLAYSLAPFDSTTAIYDTIIGNRDTIYGLFGGTFYEYSVAIICGPGDTSVPSRPFQFLTECVPYPATYFKDFEDDRDDEPAVCWDEYNTFSTALQAGAKVQNFGGFNSRNSLQISTWFGFSNTPNVDTLMAITPELGGMSLGDKRLRFMAQVDNLAHDLYILTADAPSPAANMTLIDTIEFDATFDYKQFYVDLTTANGYNGTDSVVILRSNLGATFSEVSIDNFYYEEIPSCLAPRSPFASDIAPDSALIGWTDFATGVPEWEIEYDSTDNFDENANGGLGEFTEGSEISVIVTSNPGELQGLTSNTDYTYRVRAICAAGDTSFWTTFEEFKTPCDPFTAPYFTDFDSDAANQDLEPECWSAIETWDPNFKKVEVLTFGNIRSTPNMLNINSWFNFTLGSDTLAAIMPTFSDLTVGDKRLRFWSANDNFNLASELYIMTGDHRDPSQATAMNAIDTVFYQTQNVYQEVIVNLDSANGYNRTDEYIYLVHSLGATFNDISIDDLHYEEIPSCFRTTDFDYLHFNADSTEISFTDPNGAPEFEIEYGLRGFTRGTGTKSIITSTKDTLLNLVSNDYYDVYIRAICTAGDTSFLHEASFESFCDNLPDSYTTSFEPVPNDSMPVCWARILTRPIVNFGIEGVLVVDDNFPAPRTGDKAMVFNTWQNSSAANDTVAAITPAMDSITAGDRMLTFWMTNNDFLDGSIVVATAADQNSGTTWNPLDTFSNDANGLPWVEKTVEITLANGYNGTDEHIVFYHTLNPAATFTEIQIDDIVYEKIPTCFPPIEIGAQFVGLDSAFIVWTDTNGMVSGSGDWEFEYGAAGFTLGTGIRASTVDTSNLVTGLTSGTGYDVYVRAICAAGDTSKWNNIPGKFFTRCADLTAATLPWTENWGTVDSTFLGDAIVECESSYIWNFFTTDQVRGRARSGANSVGATGAQSVTPGSGSFTMDASVGIGGDTVYNDLILTINLEDYVDNIDLELGFSMAQHDDEQSTNDSVWMRGFEGDPWVFVAANVHDLSFTAGTWRRYDGIDIDSLLWDEIQMVSNSFQLRFGQSDDFPATSPTVSDGISIDSITITGGLVVAVNEVADRLNSITIYPNPSTGLFTISIASELKENYNVTVRDIKGQKVYEENVTVNGAYKKDVDFTGFAKGVYFMQIQSETNSYVEKLVIQ